MNVEKGHTSKGLPKFDSTPFLVIGALISLALTSLSVWALIGQWGNDFLPYRLGSLLGIVVGIVLGVHCIDMIGYYRKHGRLKR